MARKIVRYQHIRDLREDSDLSQSNLAQILHCSQVAYSYYEIGKRDIPTDVLIRLAKYYSCSVDYLLGLTELRDPYPIRKPEKPKESEKRVILKKQY